MLGLSAKLQGLQSFIFCQLRRCSKRHAHAHAPELLATTCTGTQLETLSVCTHHTLVENTLRSQAPKFFCFGCDVTLNVDGGNTRLQRRGFATDSVKERL